MSEQEDFQVGGGKAGYPTVEYGGEKYRILSLSVVDSVARREGEHPVSDMLSAPIKSEPTKDKTE